MARAHLLAWGLGSFETCVGEMCVCVCMCVGVSGWHMHVSVNSGLYFACKKCFRIIHICFH